MRTIPSRHGDAHAVIERPAGGGEGRRAAAGRAKPAFLLVLTHGAGGGVDTPDLLAVRDAALALGGVVARVTQPYRVRGARAPGSAARQDEAWCDVVTALSARAGGPGVPLVLGGRSNGARLVCRTARGVRAAAVIALAFPLHPPGRPERSRRGELAGAGVPVLAVSGGKDPFGVPDPAGATEVAVLAGQGHSLTGNPAGVGAAVSSWLRGRLLCGARGAHAAGE